MILSADEMLLEADYFRNWLEAIGQTPLSLIQCCVDCWVEFNYPDYPMSFYGYDEMMAIVVDRHLTAQTIYEPRDDVRSAFYRMCSMFWYYVADSIERYIRTEHHDGAWVEGWRNKTLMLGCQSLRGA